MLDFGDFLDLFGLGEDAGDDNGVFESGGGELGEGVLPSQMGAEGVQVDFDGDGIPDAMVFQQFQDLDGDGIPDLVITEQHLDTTGDGAHGYDPGCGPRRLCGRAFRGHWPGH